MLARLEEKGSWDIIIIGGGASGVGIALDAASRGYKTLLLEKGDFAHMTRKESIRQAICHLDMEDAKRYITERFDKLDVRGSFDATTPMVEDHYTSEQVVHMMKVNGLKNIRRVSPHRRNIIAVGTKS